MEVTMAHRWQDADANAKRANAPLTIAHVMGYYAPGLGYQENFLPFEQAAAGHKVHIVTGDRYMPHPSYDTVYAPRLGPRMVGTGRHVERGVVIHRLPVRFEFSHRNNPWLAGSVALLDRISPDVVHLHGVTPLCSLRIALSASAVRRHTLVCDHHLCRFNLTPLTFPKRVYYALFRIFLSGLVKRRIRAWLPINEDAERVLREILGIDGDNVHVSRLGVDTAHFRRDPATGAAWRQLHNIDTDTTLVVHAGRLEPRKNLGDLLTAFAKAFPDGGAAALLAIAGEGEKEHVTAVRQCAATLGIQDRVLFPGMQKHDNLPALFNAADVGVWPGDPSVTVVEALGCGLPVVLSDPPGQDYVARCPGAVVISRGDIDTLTAVLTRQARTPSSERAHIACECAGRLGWSAIAADAVACYRQALAHSA